MDYIRLCWIPSQKVTDFTPGGPSKGRTKQPNYFLYKQKDRLATQQCQFVNKPLVNTLQAL